MHVEATTAVVRVFPLAADDPIEGGLTTRRGFPEAAQTAIARSREAARRRLAHVLDHPVDDLAWLAQVHGNQVRRVERGGGQGEGDALVCLDPRFLLLVSVADCSPVLLWDTDGPTFAVAHAGWRGMAAGVLESTVTSMIALGARPDRLRTWVGPCIGSCCFEVGPEVAARFAPDCVLPAGAQGRARPHVDLRRAARASLVRAGVDAARIHVAPDCTSCRSDLYWSYRRDGGICGRQLGFLRRRR